MKTFISCIIAFLLGSTSLLGQWSDNFDSYATGTVLDGVNGWQAWDNNPLLGNGTTSSLYSFSGPNSIEIDSLDDLIYQFSGLTSGTWILTAQQYVPSGAADTAWFIMQNQYIDLGPYSWSVQVNFDRLNNTVISDFDGGTLPLITDQWVELKLVIDLDHDVQYFYYGGQLLYQKSWAQGLLDPAGILNIATIDLYAPYATTNPVYYDDFLLEPVPEYIPTMSEWGRFLFLLVVLNLGAVFLFQSSKHATRLQNLV